MHSELMSPVLGNAPLVSRMTLALLEDSGWYHVDYNYAGPFRYGKGRGCNFLTEPCVQNGNTAFPNTFCTGVATAYLCTTGILGGNKGCTPDLMGEALCDICRHSAPLPSKFQRFGDLHIGGSNLLMGYCPLWISYDGSKSCRDSTHSSDPIAVGGGESFGSESRCILSEIAPRGYMIPSSPRAVCYAVSCEETQLRIRVGSEWSVCQASEAGSRKSVNGWRGQIICPSYREMCGDQDDRGPSATVPCAFPGVLRRNRCVCAPGYVGLDCTTKDTSGAHATPTLTPPDTTSEAVDISMQVKFVWQMILPLLFLLNL